MRKFWSKFKRNALYLLALLISFYGCSDHRKGESFGNFNNNVVIYGDSRTDDNAHRKIVASISKVSPHVIFHVGDLVESGNNQAQWNTFNEITFKLRKSALFYTTAGNHEFESPLYYDNFLLPNNEKWYTVIFNNILFVVINSNLNLKPGSEQYMWLNDVLSAVNANIKFKAVIFHHPPYSSGNHQLERPDLQASVVPLFEKYGVNIVFNGHDHDYERLKVNNVYYIVTGGGGAPLTAMGAKNEFSQKFKSSYNFCNMSIINDKLNVIVYDADLNIIDEFNI